MLAKKELLGKLESLYTKEEYSQARELLLKNKNLFSPGHFHYNIGTLYAKEGHLSAGRFHLEKALGKNYANKMVLNNLAVIKEQLSVGEEASFLNQSLLIPPALFTSATLVMVLVLLVAIKRKIISSSVWGLLFAILALAPWSFQKFYLSGVTSAIVLKDAPLHEGPSKIYSRSGEIPAGSKVILGQLYNGHYLVISPPNYSGHIHRDFLGLL